MANFDIALKDWAELSNLRTQNVNAALHVGGGLVDIVAGCKRPVCFGQNATKALSDQLLLHLLGAVRAGLVGSIADLIGNADLIRIPPGFSKRNNVVVIRAKLVFAIIVVVSAQAAGLVVVVSGYGDVNGFV